MKQMRSRFRLITLLLVCAFLVTLALCAGSVFRLTGFSLSSLPSIPLVSGTDSPDPSVGPEETGTPAPSGDLPSESPLPGTDNSPAPEYNVFGL